VVNSWGDSNLLPKVSTAARSTARAMCVAGWIEDGIVQEYSHEGRELLLADRKARRFRFLDAPSRHALERKPVAVFRVSNRIRPHTNWRLCTSPMDMRKGVAHIFASWCLIRPGHYLRQWKCTDRLRRQARRHAQPCMRPREQ